MGYLDVGFHPELGSNQLPEEIDLVLRNDNLGDNTFDTVELYSDVGADLWLHYFEDRSNTLEGSSFGNTTDSRLWMRNTLRLPPSGRNQCHLHHDWRSPRKCKPTQRYSRPSFKFILAIKNFSGDTTANENDLDLTRQPSSTPSDTNHDCWYRTNQIIIIQFNIEARRMTLTMSVRYNHSSGKSTRSTHP